MLTAPKSLASDSKTTTISVENDNCIEHVQLVDVCCIIIACLLSYLLTLIEQKMSIRPHGEMASMRYQGVTASGVYERNRQCAGVKRHIHLFISVVVHDRRISHRDQRFQ
jgi:hypothetical protein